MHARPLVVVALRQEAAHLAGHDVLVTGPGKVAAAAAVAAALAERRPAEVLNVGTAGTLRDGISGVQRVGTVLEHDFDRTTIEALIGEPLPGEIVLDPTSPVVLATGDRFVQQEALRRRLAGQAHLVDMEGYAVARACQAAGAACTMLKVVSDTATEEAARSWTEGIDRSARQIADVVARHLEGRT